MINFKKYSAVYDLLYLSKDYDSETKYIHELISLNNPGFKDILELGSGTGIHASALSKLGYKIMGIDMSQEMINQYKSHLDPNVVLIQGDARYFRSKTPFSNVISLFHILSYMSTNEDVENYFKSTFENLVSGGLFIFDFWYSPAVNYFRPQNRIKRVSNAELEILRVAEPIIIENENLVDVKYSIYFKNLGEEKFDCINEVHRMRHFTIPELSMYAKNIGFDIIGFEEFLSRKPVSENTWGVCAIFKKP